MSDLSFRFRFKKEEITTTGKRSMGLTLQLESKFLIHIDREDAPGDLRDMPKDTRYYKILQAPLNITYKGLLTPPAPPTAMVLILAEQKTNEGWKTMTVGLAPCVGMAYQTDADLEKPLVLRFCTYHIPIASFRSNYCVIFS